MKLREIAVQLVRVIEEQRFQAVVLSREEIDLIFDHLDAPVNLIAKVL